MNETLTPGGQALKDFVDSSFDMGFDMERATVREVVRSPCGKKRPGRILGEISEFTKTGVVTAKGYQSYDELAEADLTIYFVRA